ncbi:adenylate/guanylate cyclase domain-containing protein [Brevibacterium sp. BRM-1]|uniref:adenylate/guanylate cyclase domain-containing protein n=1 Tax=Brevibacterium sp. BRM-1 TaxID=2999062 RepID=UPI00227E6290|nr:adenylate/guanylate cyclase domain-containing protein [Brevibacterium sp. BRM-1]WAL40309.1 adenylate/guanylate cyclase domain-containing protein [Brevibacterium sp. BRM-1]
MSEPTPHTPFGGDADGNRSRQESAAGDWEQADEHDDRPDTQSAAVDGARAAAGRPGDERPADAAWDPTGTAGAQAPAAPSGGAGGFASRLADDPRTGALPIIADQAGQRLGSGGPGPGRSYEPDPEPDPDYATRSAADHLEEVLLGGKRVLKRREVAQLAGVSTLSARKFWRALGMSSVPESESAFTVQDVKALSDVAGVVEDGIVDEETILSLARALGQTTDRLVVWQMETMVEYLTDTKGLDDAQARRIALDLFEQMLDPLEDALVYAWRHNLANALSRLNTNVAGGLAMENRRGWYDSAMPLARVVGFVDLVSYTRLSQQMEPKQLAYMVKRFQDLAYNVVAAGGGRVIKTVGDEVFFAAETPHAGAEIALTLMERIKADVLLPQARVGFAWGRVLSRLGDIFGSTVNLAARLTGITRPGTVLTDLDTAQIISRTDDYRFDHRRDVPLQGLGEVTVMEMTRGEAKAMDLDLGEA